MLQKQKAVNEKRSNRQKQKVNNNNNNNNNNKMKKMKKMKEKKEEKKKNDEYLDLARELKKNYGTWKWQLYPSWLVLLEQ